MNEKAIELLTAVVVVTPTEEQAKKRTVIQCFLDNQLANYITSLECSIRDVLINISCTMKRTSWTSTSIKKLERKKKKRQMTIERPAVAMVPASWLTLQFNHPATRNTAAWERARIYRCPSTEHIHTCMWALGDVQSRKDLLLLLQGPSYVGSLSWDLHPCAASCTCPLSNVLCLPLLLRQLGGCHGTRIHHVKHAFTCKSSDAFIFRRPFVSCWQQAALRAVFITIQIMAAAGCCFFSS